MRYVFKYTKTYTRDGRIIFRRVAEVLLQAAMKKWYRFAPLVDSGADTSLFQRGDSELLGLNLKKGEYAPVVGVGNVLVPAYLHLIGAKIGAAGLRAHIAFADSDEVPRLLVRRDFFAKFRVTFDEANF